MKSPEETIGFNATSVTLKLERLKKLADSKFGPRAKRLDFYVYLGEVYRWVMAWEEIEKTNRLRELVANARGLESPRQNADAYHLVIEATCPKSKQTISKFAIALANAEAVGVRPHRLERFLEQIGGPTTICTRVGVFERARRIRKAKETRRQKG